MLEAHLLEWGALLALLLSIVFGIFFITRIYQNARSERQYVVTPLFVLAALFFAGFSLLARYKTGAEGWSGIANGAVVLAVGAIALRILRSFIGRIKIRN